MLKEIRKRHLEADKLDWGFVQLTGQQAHQDRAYLLGLWDKVSEIVNEICPVVIDEDIPDDKEEAYEKGYQDALIDLMGELKKLESEGGGMRPCPKWNSNKSICNLDSKTCLVSQYDWQNCPKGEG